MSRADTRTPSIIAQEHERLEPVLAGRMEELLRAMPATLAEPVAYAVSGGGKRIRPILCLLAYRAAGGATADAGADDVACSLELIHTYSLVHDDLPCMDDDDLRRGRPTLHRVYGSRRAAVAGVTLIPLAFRMLEQGLTSLRATDAVRREAHRELAAGAGGGGMVGGQLLDLAAEQVLVDLPALREIHSRKTGALIESSLRLGAITAGACDDMVATLGRFGVAAGLAFQIVDDVLDETSSSAVLGKTAGKDRAQAKSTFPALMGVDAAMQEAAEAMQSAVADIERAGLDPAPFRTVGEFILTRDR